MFKFDLQLFGWGDDEWNIPTYIPTEEEKESNKNASELLGTKFKLKKKVPKDNSDEYWIGDYYFEHKFHKVVIYNSKDEPCSITEKELQYMMETPEEAILEELDKISQKIAEKKRITNYILNVRTGNLNQAKEKCLNIIRNSKFQWNKVGTAFDTKFERICCQVYVDKDGTLVKAKNVNAEKEHIVYFDDFLRIIEKYDCTHSEGRIRIDIDPNCYIVRKIKEVLEKSKELDKLDWDYEKIKEYAEKHNIIVKEE